MFSGPLTRRFRFVFALSASIAALAAAPAKRPNLVVLLSDQHSWDMVGAYGNRDVRTPHLDRRRRARPLGPRCADAAPHLLA